MAQSCSVLIAASDVQPAFTQRVGAIDGDVLVFSDADALRALEAITTRRPRLVALERLFAATPRGAALINRIKADPALTQTEIRVLAHDSDYSRVLPRTPGGHAAVESSGHGVSAAHAAAAPTTAGKTATAEAPQLDQSGTRVATRHKIAPRVEVLIDGNPATLVDLSTTGGQVVSVTILKPNQRVRMALNDEQGIVRFNATIAWATFEIPPKTGPQYRAGIEFVDADPVAIDAFAARHSTT